MSLTELQITAEKDEIFVSIEIPPSVNVTAASTPELNVILAGNIGPGSRTTRTMGIVDTS